MLGRWWLLLSWYHSRDEGGMWTSAGGFLSFPGPASHPRWAAASCGTAQWGAGARLAFRPHQKAIPALHRTAACRSKGSGHARGAPALADSYKYRMVQQEAKLLNAADTTQSWPELWAGSISALLHSTLPQWLKEKFYTNKTDSSTSNTKPATKWDSSCAALPPRYLPGPHLSGFLCHNTDPHCLFAPVTSATLALQASPAPAAHLGKSSQVSRITSIPGGTMQEQKDQRCCASLAK